MQIIRRIVYESDSLEALDKIRAQNQPDGTRTWISLKAAESRNNLAGQVTMTINTIKDDCRVPNVFPGVELKEVYKMSQDNNNDDGLWLLLLVAVVIILCL